LAQNRSAERALAGSSRNHHFNREAKLRAIDAAGPSNAEQRQAEATTKAGSQAEEDMDRQRRSDSDDGHGREGADDEVRTTVGPVELMA
jgi:hypothetical protein